MGLKSRILAAAAMLACGLGLAGTAGQAGATTLTCTNTQGVTTVAGAAYGCGGLSVTSGYPFGALSIADTVNAQGSTYTSAPIVAQPADETSPRLDFTVFTVCSTGEDTWFRGRSGADYNINECAPETTTPFPAGSPPLPETLSGPGSLGIYIGMITPDGKVASFTVTTATPFTSSTPDYSGTCTQVAGGTYTNAIPCPGESFHPGAGVYCISVAQFPGPNGKNRWWALARQCNSNGIFTYGTAITPGTVNWSSANKWQEWAPQPGSSGLLLDNISLHNSSNSDYVLNITGKKGAGAQLQAYPDNTGGVANDLWDYTACTPPGTLLSVFGEYGLC